jgi:beta-glucosidase
VDVATRSGEDLQLLADLGVTDLRLGFDWARLQPAPGRVDDDWREWYEGFITTARHAGIGVWATLHETTVPAWFDDEGSFADAKATGTSWPRWVELAAELFGDTVAGWCPIHDPVGAAARWTADPPKHQDAVVNLAVAWRDAWRILRGGPPVATSLTVHMIRPVDRTVPAAAAARLEDHLRWRLWLRALRDGVVRLPNGIEKTVPDLGGALDVLGLSTTLDHPEARVSDDSLQAWQERLGTVLRRAAEEGPGRPIALTGLAVAWGQADERRLLVDMAVEALVSARQDGVDLTTVLVDPAIGTRDGEGALVSRDRDRTRDTDGWLALVDRTGDPAPD